MNKRIYIGTSGWSYKHWKGSFYPPTVKPSLWLSYYAQHFSATKINGSFYRIPSIETVIKWVENVPEHFVFFAKMSRYLTHMKKLRNPEEPLKRFFGVFEPMHKKMGPVLVQLTAMLSFHYDAAAYFFSLLQRYYSLYKFVLEVRHATWLHNDSLTLMAENNIGLVISQSDNHFPYSEAVTAKNIYVCFHSPKELYASAYSDDQLLYYADKFKGWIQEGFNVWAFFNNDIHSYAPQDAQRLMQYCLK